MPLDGRKTHTSTVYEKVRTAVPVRKGTVLNELSVPFPTTGNQIIPGTCPWYGVADVITLSYRQNLVHEHRTGSKKTAKYVRMEWKNASGKTLKKLYTYTSTSKYKRV